MDGTTDALRPCGHPMCRTCAERWVYLYGRSTCPTCKQTIVALPQDDGAVCPDHVVCVPASPDTHMGVTLRSVPAGVRIVHAHPDDLAHTAGLRVGWIITHINALPQREHASSIRLMETAAIHGVPMRIAVDARSRRRPSFLSAFVTSVRTTVSKCFRRSSESPEARDART